MDKLPLLKTRGTSEWRIVDDIRTTEAVFRTEVASNGLVAVLTYRKLSDKPINRVEIENRLKNSSIKAFDWDLIGHVLDEVIPKVEQLKDLIVAKGVPSKAGQDGKIEINFKLQKDISQIPEDEQVDYKTLNSISSVKKNDVLAKYTKPTAGENGRDVFGQVINAYQGKDSKFIAGKNTEVNEEGTAIIAELDGIPYESEGVFKVEPVFIVEKDLDLSVGNVDFVGDVIVKGDVLDGFSINVVGDLMVYGTIGAANIDVKGKITTYGGINGKNKAHVFCHQLEVKYLNEADVEIRDYAIVRKGIVNCKVSCMGRLEVNTIIGGTTIALKEINAQELGSEQHVLTTIYIGVDYKSLEAYEEGLKLQKEANKSIRSTIDTLQIYLDNPEKFYALDGDMQQKVIHMYKDFQISKRDWLKYEEQIEDCELTFRINRNVEKKFYVSKLIHEGCLIKSNRSQLKVIETKKGPLDIREVPEKHSFRMG